MAYAQKNIKSPKYRADKFFYVCSYGGCGSWMLVRYLENFGNVYHVHSKCPPNKLTYVGRENLGATSTSLNIKEEWFNDIVIPDEELHKYKVIYIYRNPLDAIYSRFLRPDHLENIEVNPKLTLLDIVEQKRDLYNIYDFYKNYTQPPPPPVNRNYKIYCVKYEDFFENIENFNREMEIPDCPQFYPTKKETSREEILREVYRDLNEQMSANDFIKIV